MLTSENDSKTQTQLSKYTGNHSEGQRKKACVRKKRHEKKERMDFLLVKLITFLYVPSLPLT